MKTDPYTGPFPRKRHSHRCLECVKRGHNAVACYKAKCALPQTIAACSWCARVSAPITTSLYSQYWTAR